MSSPAVHRVQAGKHVRPDVRPGCNRCDSSPCNSPLSLSLSARVSGHHHEETGRSRPDGHVADRPPSARPCPSVYELVVWTAGCSSLGLWAPAREGERNSHQWTAATVEDWRSRPSPGRAAVRSGRSTTFGAPPAIRRSTTFPLNRPTAGRVS